MQADRFIQASCALLLAVATAAHGAVVYTETFGSGANGWGDRDSGEMAVSGPSSLGVPASQAMQGQFSASILPMTDAFRISSGGNFVGNYSGYGNGLTRIKFDLYAENVVPSDLFIRLLDGTDVYSYQFSLGSFGIDTWTTFTVDLDYAFGWAGPGGSGGFSTALTSVDHLEIQLTRNGNSSQLYYLDNVQTLDDDLGGGGGGGAVPEPSTGVLVLSFAVVMYGRLRQMKASRRWKPAF